MEAISFVQIRMQIQRILEQPGARFNGVGADRHTEHVQRERVDRIQSIPIALAETLDLIYLALKLLQFLHWGTVGLSQFVEKSVLMFYPL